MMDSCPHATFYKSQSLVQGFFSLNVVMACFTRVEMGINVKKGLALDLNPGPAA